MNSIILASITVSSALLAAISLVQFLLN